MRWIILLLLIFLVGCADGSDSTARGDTGSDGEGSSPGVIYMSFNAGTSYSEKDFTLTGVTVTEVNGDIPCCLRGRTYTVSSGNGTFQWKWLRFLPGVVSTWYTRSDSIYFSGYSSGYDITYAVYIDGQNLSYNTN